MTLAQMKLFLKEAAALDKSELRRMVSAIGLALGGDENALRELNRD